MPKEYLAERCAGLGESYRRCWSGCSGAAVVQTWIVVLAGLCAGSRLECPLDPLGLLGRPFPCRSHRPYHQRSFACSSAVVSMAGIAAGASAGFLQSVMRCLPPWKRQIPQHFELCEAAVAATLSVVALAAGQRWLPVKQSQPCCLAAAGL